MIKLRSASNFSGQNNNTNSEALPSPEKAASLEAQFHVPRSTLGSGSNFKTASLLMGVPPDCGLG